MKVRVGGIYRCAHKGIWEAIRYIGISQSIKARLIHAEGGGVRVHRRYGPDLVLLENSIAEFFEDGQNFWQTEIRLVEEITP